MASGTTPDEVHGPYDPSHDGATGDARSHGGGRLAFGVAAARGDLKAAAEGAPGEVTPSTERSAHGPTPAAAPMQAVPSMTIRTGAITIEGRSVTGEVTLTLRKSGVCTFLGRFHNAGLSTVDVTFALVVVSSSGRAFSFAQSGKATGAVGAGSHDLSWAESPTHGDIAADWDALFSDCTYQWRAGADLSLTGAVEDLVKVIQSNGGNLGSLLPVNQGGGK
jgi:hypothetical protein